MTGLEAHLSAGMHDRESVWLDAVRSWADGLPVEYLLCHELNHAFEVQRQKVREADRPGVTWNDDVSCERCGYKIHRDLDSRGRIISSVRSPPDGWHPPRRPSGVRGITDSLPSGTSVLKERLKRWRRENVLLHTEAMTETVPAFPEGQSGLNLERTPVAPDARKQEGAAQKVPLENFDREIYRRGVVLSIEAQQREWQLVQRYARHLREAGHEVCSYRIPIGIGSDLRTDLFDETARELVEAKSGVLRSDLRMALGEILDYARFVEPERLAVLVPSKPAGDLIDLLIRYDVSCIYELRSGVFRRISTGVGK